MRGREQVGVKQRLPEKVERRGKEIQSLPQRKKTLRKNSQVTKTREQHKKFALPIILVSKDCEGI